MIPFRPLRVLSACLALLAGPVLAAGPAYAQLTREGAARLAFEQRLEEAAALPEIVGLAVAVVRAGEPPQIYTYGRRRADAPDPVTPETVFRIGSLSKAFAATLALIEARDGALSLSDPISRFEPAFRLASPSAAAKVTLEAVLSQRTGLPPYAYDNLLEEGRTPAAILPLYGKLKAFCAPGSCHSYQNIAFNLTATAVEKATGKTYPVLLGERIFAPLGMAGASATRAGLVNSPNWARPHVRNETNTGWRIPEVNEVYYRVPAAGGVNASINDMARWLAAQMGAAPSLLSDDMLAELRRARVATPTETRRQTSNGMPVSRTSYGLGWRVYDYAGHEVIAHAGSVEGYMAQLSYLPSRRTGIVVLTNTRSRRPSQIAATFLDLELGLPDADRMGIAAWKAEQALAVKPPLAPPPPPPTPVAPVAPAADAATGDAATGDAAEAVPAGGAGSGAAAGAVAPAQPPAR